MRIVLVFGVCVAIVAVGRRGERERYGRTHHNDKRVTLEEPCIEIRDKPDGECAGCGRDITLAWELQPNKLIYCPTEA